MLVPIKYLSDTENTNLGKISNTNSAKNIVFAFRESGWRNRTNIHGIIS